MIAFIDGVGAAAPEGKKGVSEHLRICKYLSYTVNRKLEGGVNGIHDFENRPRK